VHRSLGLILAIRRGHFRAHLSERFVPASADPALATFGWLMSGLGGSQVAKH